jgi:hypothetical protein
MSYHAFNGLDAPVGKYQEILDYVLTPSPTVKQVDLCCGLGFGKTVLAIQAAALTLNLDGNQRLLFLEPDWDRVNDTFLTTWQRVIPSDMYKIQVGKNLIHWWNGSQLIFRPRVITGSRERIQDKFRGIEFTAVVDDETAIGFDYVQYLNTFARIRAPSKIRYYFTLSTPKVGPYGRFINRGTNKLFTGRTADNHYLLARDPDYEKNLRLNMSADQARRELDGELIALEGRIWKTAMPNIPWPMGNRNDNHRSFDKKKPWWLFCDFGSSTGAYAVIQKTDSVHNGREMFKGDVWVAVADLCPRDDASASRAFQKLKTEFGFPAGVVGGRDMNKRSDGGGDTVAYFAQQSWSNVQIYPCDETTYNKQLQYDRLSYLMCSALGERRFTIAKDFISLEPESHSGIREMIDEDAWPAEDKRRAGDFLPKNKDIRVQHVRDALLMGAVEVMAPPDWHYQDDPPR